MEATVRKRRISLFFFLLAFFHAPFARFSALTPASDTKGNPSAVGGAGEGASERASERENRDASADYGDIQLLI